MPFLSRFLSLAFICLFFPFAVKAQSDFSVQGALFENGTTLRIALAEITNLRTRVSTGSNDMGVFNLKARVGDTLLITKRSFREVKLLVSSGKDIVVKMNRDATTLDQVVITGTNKKKELEAIKQDFKNKGSFYAGKPPAKLLIPFGGSPLTFLYELFGKTPKAARRFGRMYQNEMQQISIDQYFNKSFIASHSDLDASRIEDYMVNHRPNYEKAKTWTEYDYLAYIAKTSKKYTDSVAKIK